MLTVNALISLKHFGACGADRKMKLAVGSFGIYKDHSGQHIKRKETSVGEGRAGVIISVIITVLALLPWQNRHCSGFLKHPLNSFPGKWSGTPRT